MSTACLPLNFQNLVLIQREKQELARSIEMDAQKKDGKLVETDRRWCRRNAALEDELIQDVARLRIKLTQEMNEISSIMSIVCDM